MRLSGGSEWEEEAGERARLDRERERASRGLWGETAQLELIKESDLQLTAF